MEVSFGVERLLLAVLESAYREEEINEKEKITTRSFLQLPALLVPYFVAIIPQPASKENRGPEIQDQAYQLYCHLLKEFDFSLTYEEASSIGKSYRRQDAIGTYYCLTVDFQTAQDQKITCRNRDTMKQNRIDINSLKKYLYNQYEKH